MYRILAIIPYIMLIVAIPYVNHEEPYIFGLPFLLFWISLWVVLSSLIMLLIYKIEHKNEKEQE